MWSRMHRLRLRLYTFGMAEACGWCRAGGEGCQSEACRPPGPVRWQHRRPLPHGHQANQARRGLAQTSSPASRLASSEPDHRFQCQTVVLICTYPARLQSLAYAYGLSMQGSSQIVRGLLRGRHHCGLPPCAGHNAVRAERAAWGGRFPVFNRALRSGPLRRHPDAELGALGCWWRSGPICALCSHAACL